MTALRVAFLLPNLRPGGAELQMLQLARRLPRERFRVEFLPFIGEGPLDAVAADAGITVHPIGTTSLHDAPAPVRAIGRAVKLATYARIVRSHRYDIVDAWIYPLDVVAAATRPLAPSRVLVSGRRNIDPRRSFGPLSAAFDRLASRGVDAVIANSCVAADLAIREDGIPPAKVRVIHNGVEPIERASDAERRALRRSMSVADGDFAVGCVGHFREDKRHDLLIAAFAELVPRHPELRLVLIGDGDNRARIERQILDLGIGDRVRLIGTVLDARPLYAAFDLLVQASRREGLPNVLLEASAAGLPIVATAAGGSVEIVLDGETGVIVPTDDRGALVGAIERMVDDAALRARVGAGARAHVAACFGIDRFVAAFADTYEELVDSRRVHKAPRP